MKHLKPTRTTIGAVVGLLWLVSFGAVRDFVWADLREGMMTIRDLNRVMRLLVVVGFGLVFGMVTALLFNDVWRAVSAFIVVQSQSAANRGVLLPQALLPVTLWMLALAWSFMLAGAMHSHPLMRVAALGLYAITAINMTTSALSALVGSPVLGYIALGAVALVALVFVGRWRAQPQPVAEWLAMLALVSVTFALNQHQGVSLWRLSDTPLVIVTLSYNIEQMQSLALPLLFLIGVDIAAFTEQAARWTTSILTERLPGVVMYAALVAFGGWRLRDVVAETGARLATNGALNEVGVYANALLVPGLVFAAWWLVRRLGNGAADAAAVRHAAESWALPLIIAYNAVALIYGVLLTLATTLPALGQLLNTTDAAIQWANAVHSVADATYNAGIAGWAYVVIACAGGGAVFLARRGKAALALYLLLFALLDLRSRLMEPGLPLAPFVALGNGSPVDGWWVLLFVGIGAWWAVRRALTPRRASGLLFLLLVTGLLKQTDFIENPFSPFLGFAGIGFIAFGIMWDVLTRGAWANVGSPALPRTSRILLYLGYVLLSVTVVNWAVATHDLATTARFTGDAAVNGLLRFGRPILYAIFAITLAALVREEASAP